MGLGGGLERGGDGLPTTLWAGVRPSGRCVELLCPTRCVAPEAEFGVRGPPAFQSLGLAAACGFSSRGRPLSVCCGGGAMWSSAPPEKKPRHGFASLLEGGELRPQPAGGRAEFLPPPSPRVFMGW